jgi:glycosyltransferase involved in cell wall biosynthesis
VQLTALVDRPDHVCCRYRLTAFRPWIEQAGHRLELRPWPRSWWSWFRLGKELAYADVVILQRKLLQNWQRYLLRRAARFLVFDFDDAIFLRDSYAAKGLHSAGRLRRCAALVKAADVVMAGNTFLRDWAGRWAGKDRVHLMPTCVDPLRYPLAEHNGTGEEIQLVWIGSSSTLRGLEAVRPLLEEIGRRLPGLSLKLICDCFLRLDRLRVQPCPWTEAGETRALAAADIGISFIPDDPWSRGKCGLKVLQYMAAGLPVVGNPVGVQADLIRHGETGFLVKTPEQWVAALGRLAGEPRLRRRMGRAGRRRVEAEFSVAAGAARWGRFLKMVGGRRALAG